MKRRPATCSLLMMGLASVLLQSVRADERKHDELRAKLEGLQEVPAVSTTASASFRADADIDAGMITYTLSYEGLTGNVTQAHLHVGHFRTNGAISVWLCGNESAGPPPIAPPPGTQPCPASPATITGTILAANVVGPAGQGISAGELAELLAMIRANAVYANVHTTAFPGGEVRGQVH